MTDLAIIAGAVLLAAAGGEAFLKSILGIAGHLRVPTVVVASTLAAFATSAPELTVSSVAALAGEPQIGLGDALGSNVVNIALIFGVALLFGPVQTLRGDFGRDFYLALGIPVLTFILFLDDHLDRADAGILFLIFVVWLVISIRRAVSGRAQCMEQQKTSPPMTSIVFGFAGLAALIAAGRMFVAGATGLASTMEVDTYIIGVVLVAIGTSLPELVTVILARMRGHDDIGVGTLIGSNLFNGLAIVGIAGLIHPIALPQNEVALTLGCGLVALILLLPDRAGVIARWRATWLFLLYTGFVWATFNFPAQS